MMRLLKFFQSSDYYALLFFHQLRKSRKVGLGKEAKV